MLHLTIGYWLLFTHIERVGISRMQNFFWLKPELEQVKQDTPYIILSIQVLCLVFSFVTKQELVSKETTQHRSEDSQNMFFKTLLFTAY